MQDIDSYERMQETVALPKMLALGDRQVEAAGAARLRRRRTALRERTR